MAKVRPFKAFRTSTDKVHLVASRSYISYSRKDLIRKLDENPFTFLHILNPEYKTRKTFKAHSEARFKLVQKKFFEFVEEGVLQQDSENSFYIYQQTKDGHQYLGLIACASVDDYFKGVIKKHEATISRRENMFKNYLKATEINAEPVCFTYPNHSQIDFITQSEMQKRPDYDFTTTDRVNHKLWSIAEKETVKALENAFAEVDSIYIADGHHRSASSALMGKELANKNPNHTGEELYNYFMGFFIPERHLQIFAFNRLIADLAGLSSEAFIAQLQNNFELQKISAAHYKPSKMHEIGMYLDQSWYSLEPKKELVQSKNPVDHLDVAILSQYILSPILGIHDLRTDKRVSFLGELAGLDALEREVNSGRARLAFAHFPVSMEQLKEVSDAHEIMPPKSTWIEPKLRSGLTVFSTNEKTK